MNQGKSQEALAASETALSFDPTNFHAWNGKGNALLALGRIDEAHFSPVEK